MCAKVQSGDVVGPGRLDSVRAIDQPVAEDTQGFRQTVDNGDVARVVAIEVGDSKSQTRCRLELCHAKALGRFKAAATLAPTIPQDRNRSRHQVCDQNVPVPVPFDVCYRDLQGPLAHTQGTRIDGKCSRSGTVQNRCGIGQKIRRHKVGEPIAIKVPTRDANRTDAHAVVHRRLERPVAASWKNGNIAKIGSAWMGAEVRYRDIEETVVVEKSCHDRRRLVPS